MTWHTELADLLDNLGRRVDRMDHAPLTFDHLEALVFQLRKSHRNGDTLMDGKLRKATDREFLNWIADRLVYIYGESQNVDFVLRLREISKSHELT